jgi:hypothetical protein
LVIHERLDLHHHAWVDSKRACGISREPLEKPGANLLLLLMLWWRQRRLLL